LWLGIASQHINHIIPYCARRIHRTQDVVNDISKVMYSPLQCVSFARVKMEGLIGRACGGRRVEGLCMAVDRVWVALLDVEREMRDKVV
jgi:hypothetical protein